MESKTVQTRAFDVPAGVEALTLRFDYRPRSTEDAATIAPAVEAAFELHTRRRAATASAEEIAAWRQTMGIEGRSKMLHNLLNVTIVDPKGVWRGRWDRNPAGAGMLLLARTAASRGFLPGAIEPGRWTAAVEIHGVFGGEAVTWELEVDARDAPTADELAALVEPSAPGPARRRGPGWYFGELHSHSVHSDGRHEIADLAGRVAARGADFLALTDHNTLSGHLDPPAVPLTLIPGCELTTFHGHHPLYGLREMPPWHLDGRVVPLSEIAPGVRAQGGVVGVAHPFVPGDPLCTGCRMPSTLDPKDFDVMEVWYRRWQGLGSDNEAAYQLWNKFWREGRRIVATAARDWHGPEQDEVFPGEFPFTGVYAEDNTAEAIIDGLRRGRVIMTGGPILDLTLAAGGGLALELARLDAPAELRLYRDGDVEHRAPISRDGAVPLPTLTPGAWRAELWAGALPRVITNHVVLEA